MRNHGIFPFGEEVRIVAQADRSPKSVFVLGVYASAVHARWVDPAGAVRVHALAVASEPEVFWRGDGAVSVISQIAIPDAVGHLEPAGKRFNGPSGRSLDSEFLSPLRLTRDQVWLCDLYPYAHMNPRQRSAIERAYLPLMERFALPEPRLRPAPTRRPDQMRCQEVWEEIIESQAKTLILLGDKPIKWFLQRYVSGRTRLAHYGVDASSYGRLHRVDIEGRRLDVLPLVHLRQASRLGTSSPKWWQVHRYWKANTAPLLEL
ncbi:MAG: hypothetical protein JSW37_08625 [Anaerolineales bacterium]|nr:MAG: hypothetical protein JSW37_08625 [Anaerolineales bacterium]